MFFFSTQAAGLITFISSNCCFDHTHAELLAKISGLLLPCTFHGTCRELQRAWRLSVGVPSPVTYIRSKFQLATALLCVI